MRSADRMLWPILWGRSTALTGEWRDGGLIRHLSDCPTLWVWWLCIAGGSQLLLALIQATHLLVLSPVD